MGLRADLLCLQYWPFHRQHLGRMKLCVTDYLGVRWATRVCDLSIPELQLKPIKTSSEMFLRARYWICEGINGFVETVRDRFTRVILSGVLALTVLTRLRPEKPGTSPHLKLLALDTQSPPRSDKWSCAFNSLSKVLHVGFTGLPTDL